MILDRTSFWNRIENQHFVSFKPILESTNIKYKPTKITKIPRKAVKFLFIHNEH